eukprot:365928-Chlamydomonas_euryale.AAC.13
MQQHACRCSRCMSAACLLHDACCCIAAAAAAASAAFNYMLLHADAAAASATCRCRYACGAPDCARITTHPLRCMVQCVHAPDAQSCHHHVACVQHPLAGLPHAGEHASIRGTDRPRACIVSAEGC